MMAEKEFAELAREYHESLGDYEPEKIECNAFFQSYDSMWDQIQLQVTNQLPKTRTKNGQDDSLDWEFESDEELDEEEVDAFRDEPLSRPELVERQDTFKEVEEEPTNYRVLEDHFHQELSKAHILAEFDERYIQSVLQIRRESNGNTQGLELGERHRLWEQTVKEHPLLVLENLSRGLMNQASRPAPRPEFVAQESTATIQGLEDDVIELSEASRTFSRFIPNTVPQLNVDQDLLE
jgi:hypothetical protein